MKRIFRSCMFAGLATSGLTIANVAYGQASAQSQSQVAAPTPQGLGAMTGSAPFPGSTAPGNSAFPRGYQSASTPASPAQPFQASGQSASASGIPYPRSVTSFPRGYQAPQAAPGASPQADSVGRIPYPRSGSSFPRGYQPAPTLAATPQAAGPGGVPMSASRQSAPTDAGHYPNQAPATAAPTGQAGVAGVGTIGGPMAGTGAAGAGAGAGPAEAGMGAGAGIPGAGGAMAGAGTGAEAPTRPGAAVPPGTAPAGAEAALEALGELGADTGPFAALGGAPGGGPASPLTPNMIGDLSPFYAHPAAGTHAPPLPQGPHGAALFYPTVRNFKVSENQSPRPQDRVFWDFNFYSNVNSTVNTAQRSPINQMNAYTYLWGFEKTFDQGNGSIGMRLPLNSLTATSNTPGVSAPTSTALGNLDIFAKYILKQNVETGSLITAGFQITPQTATSRFAGAPYIYGLNTTYFQPFIAYIWQRDKFYIQGFSGFDFPANNADVTLMYNDIGIGYMLYRNLDSSRLITAIAPTFEVHVNTPFNHRNPYNTYDPAASTYVTNLTYGLNVMFYGRSMLTAALVTPVSSPKPFDAEFALLFNYFFGRTVRRPTQILPPVIQ